MLCLVAQAQAESIVAFLSNEGHVKQLKQDKAYNLAFLQEVFQIGPPQIDALFHYAKFQFDCGNYSVAAEFLYHYRCVLSACTNSHCLGGASELAGCQCPAASGGWVLFQHKLCICSSCSFPSGRSQCVTVYVVWPTAAR